MDADSPSSEPSESPASARLLDNPIWHALLTDHRSLAIGTGAARRYPSEIGPLSGVPDQSEASYRDLRNLACPGRVLALFFQEPPSPPPDWTLLRTASLVQMIWKGGAVDSTTIPPNVTLRPLSHADVSEMVALAELTEPGPFRHRTLELGKFWGIFDAGRLVAMAGQRMSLPGYIEVSAVCTHPDARGRGFAHVVSSIAMRDILERRRTPFLHALADNHSAIRVYESLGFALRRAFHLAVLKKQA